MLPAARAEKVQVLFAVGVFAEQTFNMPAQLVFRTERAGQLHGIFEFERVRDIFMQLLQRGQADLAEHLRLNFRCGVGDIGVVVETFHGEKPSFFILFAMLYPIHAGYGILIV